MAATPTTRWQVGGHRFLVRRLEHAIVRRDPRMIHDPMRSQSRALMVGAVLAVIGLAVAGALALFRPRDMVGDAAILVGRDSAALYIVEDGVVHPTTNLASARLVVGSPDEPTRVSDSQLGEYPVGPLVGIVGAPSALPADTADPRPGWAVCDTLRDGHPEPVSTAVLVTGAAAPDAVRPLGDRQALLWSNAGRTFLVHGGVRSAVDINDRAVVRALGLDPAAVTPVSTSVLDAVREVPAIYPPVIPRVGEPPTQPFGDRPVGSVVTVERNDGAEYYLVLDDGVQQIPATVADLIRYADARTGATIDVVAPGELSDVPTTARPVSIDMFPTEPLDVLARGTHTVQCLTWTSSTPTEAAEGGELRAQVAVAVGSALPLAADARMTELAGADGPGPLIDEVHIDRPAGYFAVATGAGTNEVRRDGAFVVANTGVRYGVPDVEAQEALGVGLATAGPWPILRLLPEGPVLARDRARVLHDGDLPDEAVRSLGER